MSVALVNVWKYEFQICRRGFVRVTGSIANGHSPRVLLIWFSNDPMTPWTARWTQSVFWGIQIGLALRQPYNVGGYRYRSMSSSRNGRLRVAEGKKHQCFWNINIFVQHIEILPAMFTFNVSFKHRFLAFDVDITIFLVNLLIHVNCVAKIVTTTLLIFIVYLMLQW